MCCGGIIGMGESREDVADMLMDVKEINPESVPINFSSSNKGNKACRQRYIRTYTTVLS